MHVVTWQLRHIPHRGSALSTVPSNSLTHSPAHSLIHSLTSHPPSTHYTYTCRYFLTGERFSADAARHIGLLHEAVDTQVRDRVCVDVNEVRCVFIYPLLNLTCGRTYCLLCKLVDALLVYICMHMCVRMLSG